MMGLKEKIKSYLLSFQEEKFKYIITDLDLIKLSKTFLRRNGLVITDGDFSFHLFLALKKNRSSILILIEEESDIGRIVGRIVNMMLKEMGGQIYSDKKRLKNEMLDQDIIDNYGGNFCEFEDMEEGVWNIVASTLDRESSTLYREAMASHLGVNRPYKLSFDMIKEIFNIKRSTFYKKLKDLKNISLSYDLG